MADVRPVLQLLAGAAEMASSKVEQAQWLRVELCRLFKAPVGLYLTCQSAQDEPGGAMQIDMCAIGLPPRAAAAVRRRLRAGIAQRERSAPAPSAIEPLTAESWPAHARAIQNTLGLRFCLSAVHAAASDAPRFRALTLLRQAPDQPFTDRERLMAETLYPLIANLCHRMPTADVAAPAELPPHLQRVLERLLAGSSEKQIARDLNLTYNTVHFYVGRLYRRFKVSSRGELMARHVAAHAVQAAAAIGIDSRSPRPPTDAAFAHGTSDSPFRPAHAVAIAIAPSPDAPLPAAPTPRELLENGLTHPRAHPAPDRKPRRRAWVT